MMERLGKYKFNTNIKEREIEKWNWSERFEILKREKAKW